MLVLADAAFTKTIGIIITFGGIGLLVNGLIIYVIALALGERSENRRHTGPESEAS